VVVDALVLLPDREAAERAADAHGGETEAGAHDADDPQR
jgi:hypothetical protein